MPALVLTYHGVESSAGPLFIDPELFGVHLDCIVDSGATPVTITELAGLLETDRLPKSVVAITFDDGLASVALNAAPLLEERGLSATVFCVGGRLGRRSDWPTRLADAPVRDLASAGDLRELIRAGFEIGSHGMEHAPLVRGDDNELRLEIVRSKDALEQAVGAPVRSFAYPYGAGPNEAARALVGDTYSAACSTILGYVRRGDDPFLLPRVDAYYVRRPRLLRAALDGSLTTYFAARRVIGRGRRLARSDYALP